MLKSSQSPKQAVHKLRRGRAGLFLPDALCLKKKVLTDSWAPGPYSARVQCGCLANEVDYRDYNQTGNISVLMCQSSWENLPVLQCQRGLFSFRLVLFIFFFFFLPYNNTEPCHRVPRVALRHAGLWQLLGEGVMVGNLTMGSIPRPPVNTEGNPKCTNYLLLANVAVKCRFNPAVFNLSIIIQRKVDFKLGLNPHFAPKCINGHWVWPCPTSSALTSPSPLGPF